MPNGVALPSIQQTVPSSTDRTDRLLASPPAPTRIIRWKCPWAKEIVPLSAGSREYGEESSFVLGWQMGTLPLGPKEPSHHDTSTSTSEPSSAGFTEPPDRPARDDRPAS